VPHQDANVPTASPAGKGASLRRDVVVHPTPRGGIHHPIRAIPEVLKAAIVEKSAKEGSEMTLNGEVDDLESPFGNRFR
jgi:hypothetical protein